MAGNTNHPPVVYYLMSQFGGVVKIGTTVNLAGRMRRMERAQPAMKANVIVTEPGAELMEAYRHREFRNFRQVGDWFWLTPELIAHIRQLGGEL
ncbi:MULTISPECIES: GIY-YIG nuclease family protein [unclassified Cryobacterium]|uniref:GIY-YIG nuclease family protein n=1 Tax=unclassified Cryobacterium TaxID=2649013 RepID=UPI00106DA0ED|nr:MULTISPECIES: GIY-YIG nuclease family protein [unclassified Cryobacterium]TFC59444.1 hypothetical protein E3O68_00660 [Cryobacterium sp. TMB3-1-2]TFC67240.1 hypothetical protein E3T21_17355 [Cryobacterium sp. TMB3-15]TFC73247.1 hypothetical protein E3T22_16700 [Cryobacterium sp. TMB3-10]TFD46135.1 hypothetical protein E3T58_01335 [Cryobacterium sp. TMB3-12]